MMATAFCPAHITGFFKAELDKEDSKQLGSLGAGFSIQKGVKTTVTVRERTKHDISDFAIKVNGFESGDMRVSELVLSRFSVKGKFIDVTHDIDVPVGYGFGCSAAVALSLSIALNDALNCKLTKIQVAQIAHDIEIECRTGLGDVLASYHGGFEVRVKPGAPGIGQVKKINSKEKRDVIIICFNPISTKKFLKEKISYLLKVNNISNGSVKVHISRSGAGRYTPESNDPDLLISTISGSPYKSNDPISLCFYEEEYKASGLLSNIKSVNSLISVLASIYSDKNNFDNAILLTDNEIRG